MVGIGYHYFVNLNKPEDSKPYPSPRLNLKVLQESTYVWASSSWTDQSHCPLSPLSFLSSKRGASMRLRRVDRSSNAPEIRFWYFVTSAGAQLQGFIESP
jgi:hypothetical protein